MYNSISKFNFSYWKFNPCCSWISELVFLIFTFGNCYKFSKFGCFKELVISMFLPSSLSMILYFLAISSNFILLLFWILDLPLVILCCGNFLNFYNFCQFGNLVKTRLCFVYELVVVVIFYLHGKFLKFYGDGNFHVVCFYFMFGLFFLKFRL